MCSGSTDVRGPGTGDRPPRANPSNSLNTGKTQKTPLISNVMMNRNDQDIKQANRYKILVIGNCFPSQSYKSTRRFSHIIKCKWWYNFALAILRCSHDCENFIGMVIESVQNTEVHTYIFISMHNTPNYILTDQKTYIHLIMCAYRKRKTLPASGSNSNNNIRRGNHLYSPTNTTSCCFCCCGRFFFSNFRSECVW